MRVIYNLIDMGALETQEFSITPVYDDSGVDYLYSQVAIAIRAVINGQVRYVTGEAKNGPYISYNWAIGTGGTELNAGVPASASTDPEARPSQSSSAVAPVGLSPGSSPTVPAGTGLKAAPITPIRSIQRIAAPTPVSHTVIRHRLSMPRGKLFIFSGPGTELDTFSPIEISSSNLFVRSPADGYEVDCKNGPIPKVLNITSALGDSNSLIVDWSCVAYINEGELNRVAKNGALLSNRFSQVHEIDADGYTTTFTSGVAIYRTDLLWKNFTSPDVDRSLLFMPVPSGFVRTNIQVTGMPDVTGVHYAYTDRQVEINFPVGPLARASSISVEHTQKLSTKDGIDTLLGAYEKFRYMGGLGDQSHAPPPRLMQNARHPFQTPKLFGR